MKFLTLQDRLKYLRKKKGLSQRKLAEEIKVSAGNVGDWERGRSKPSMTAITLLSNFFDIDPQWLLTGKGTHPDEDKSEAKKIIENIELETNNDGTKMKKRDREKLKRIMEEAETFMLSAEEELSDDDIDTIISVMRHSFNMATDLNKKKKKK